MGKHTQYQAPGAKRAQVAAALLALAFAAPDTSAAQSATPSGGFDLRPGAPAEAPPSNVQGPVDAESPPPVNTEPAPAPTTAPPVVTPVPVPQTTPAPTPRTRERAPAAESATRARSGSAETRQQQDAEPEVDTDAPEPEAQTAEPEAAAPALPQLAPAPSAPDEPIATDEPAQDDGSIWLWLAAGLVALVALIAMAWRSHAEKRAAVAIVEEPTALVATVPTPPLRAKPVTAPAPPAPVQPPVRAPAPAPAPAAPAIAKPVAPPVAPAPAPERTVAPAPAAPPPPAPELANVAATPRLLLDYTTLGVDVTLVNAIARYHLGITNTSEIAITDVVLHGAVVQARRGMPSTIDPMMGDQLLPKLQTVANIGIGETQRCEGQIRLPLAQIEPIAMQGRLLFVPVVHMWIGYHGPDGSRYAVTQSFVLGEENTPPGPRVGPLRLDLGPRRFTAIGQRPLQPA